MSGFGAVLDELRQAAGRIDDVIGGVPGKPWRGPSGDYRHAAVQQSWAGFIENAKREVENLCQTVAGHGERFREAVAKYREDEVETGGVIVRIGDLLDGESGGLDPNVVPGGGIAGGLDIGIGEGSGGGRSGVLDPDAVPGGGFTGGNRNIVDGPADGGTGAGGLVAELGRTTDPKELVPGEPELIASDLRELVGNIEGIGTVGGDLRSVDPARGPAKPPPPSATRSAPNHLGGCDSPTSSARAGSRSPTTPICSRGARVRRSAPLRCTPRRRPRRGQRPHSATRPREQAGHSDRSPTPDSRSRRRPSRPWTTRAARAGRQVGFRGFMLIGDQLDLFDPVSDHRDPEQLVPALELRCDIFDRVPASVWA